MWNENKKPPQANTVECRIIYDTITRCNAARITTYNWSLRNYYCKSESTATMIRSHVKNWFLRTVFYHFEIQLLYVKCTTGPCLVVLLIRCWIYIYVYYFFECVMVNIFLEGNTRNQQQNVFSLWHILIFYMYYDKL